MALIRENGRPSSILLELASHHGIEVSDQMTGKELSQAMQERWLRKTEHQYQIPGGPPSRYDLTLLKYLKLVDPIFSRAESYAGALILGATIVGVRKRLAYLVKEWECGAEIPTAYMLGGARPLDKDKESPVVLTTPAELPFKAGWKPPAELPTTEAGMMRLVFEQSDIPPWEGVIIDAPLQTTPEGKTRHPNTTDTVKEFLKGNPKPGVYLSVSSQPFIARQTINVEQALPKSFTIIGIGYGSAATTPLKTFLDETARLLYEEVSAT